MLELLEPLRDSEGYIALPNLPEDFAVVEESDWIQEHKTQCAEHIIVHVESGRHFCLNQRRYGSYHSYWDYIETDLMEVEQVTETVVVTKWVPV